jgi:hypothetical protein
MSRDITFAAIEDGKVALYNAAGYCVRVARDSVKGGNYTHVDKVGESEWVATSDKGQLHWINSYAHITKVKLR